jgi:hypothetical protein
MKRALLSPRLVLLPIPMSRFLLCLGLLLAGCGKGPVPVLDLQVSKGDWNDYHRSLESIDGRQTAEEKAEFARALLDLKYQALMEEGRTAGPAINAAVREQIAGVTVRDVLILGHTIRLDRKREEEKALVRSILMNHRLRTKPGDVNSASVLASTHANQDQQLTALRAEIASLEKRLGELGPSPAKSGPAVVPMKDLDERPALQKPV